MNDSAQQMIADLKHRGVRLSAYRGRLILDAPKGVLTPQEIERVRAAKSAIVALLAHPVADPAAKALTLLKQLRCYTLPAGRMIVMNRLAKTLEPFAAAADPAAILSALRDFEWELIALGGAPDPELTEAMTMIERTFPGARLVEVRKL